MLQALAAATLLLQLLLLHAAPAAELHDGQPNILIALGGSNTLGAKDMNGTFFCVARTRALASSCTSL